jgi:hypothetical protein
VPLRSTAGPTCRARPGITGVDSILGFSPAPVFPPAPPRAIWLLAMAAAHPGGGGGSVAARPPGDDAYEGDESGGGYNTGGGGALSPGRMRADSPEHRAAAALSRAVYNSPANTSHRWASAFGGVE